ncbi:MAG TPA: hypothetical protein VD772_01270 [Anseongella sp.]|nr:hypothetical protein [Anseongella sp.]
MKKLLLMLSLALAGLSVQAQVTLQERAYQLDSFYKFIVSNGIDGQGSVMLSGLINPGGTGSVPHYSKLLLLKSDTDTLWTLRGPDVPDFLAYAGVRARVNGGFSFATYIKKAGPTTDQYDGVLEKLSPNGTSLMTKMFNPANDNNSINSFLTMLDKGYLLMGEGGIPNVSSTVALTRTDSSGNFMWQRNHSRNFYSWSIHHMEHAPHGRIIMAGAAPTPNPGSDPFKIKLLLLNANGDSVKAKTLVLTTLNRSEIMLRSTDHCLLSLTDGGFLFTALVDTLNTNMGVVAKVDSNLQVVWKYIHRPGPSMTNGIFFTRAKELKDGSIMVLGQDWQQNGFQLYRFSAQGQRINTYSLTSSLFPKITVATLDVLPDSSFMIGGQCRTAGNAQTGFYVAKVKIAGLPGGVTATVPETASEPIALGQSYPNPTAAMAIIPYSLPKSYRRASILISEIATGRQLRSYELKRGQSSLSVDVSRLSNGLYTYTLVVDEKPVATRKLAVLK